ncbi:MAG: hypothetical protein IJ226_03855, partial [Clostridia bacterium]|nr:hypothetical protein [Clostridia bacterium]
LWAKNNGASPSRRTEYQSGHTHAVVAVATPIPSSNERVGLPATLRTADVNNKDTKCPSSKE